MNVRVLALASAAAVAASSLAIAPARAALDQGTLAPEFKATAYLGGEKYDFDLDKALKKGPVVVYFFPAAFTHYCSGKFPIAADTDGSIAKLYASSLVFKPGWSGRDSYVVAPDHKIVLTYSNLNPNDHVSQTLAAVTKLNGKS